jgi:hypothetical protein
MRTISLALLAVACVSPRPMLSLGPAMSMGRNTTDVSVGVGVGYSSQSNPPTERIGASGEPQRDQSVGRAFALPTFEANFQHAFSKRVAINAHLSPAGLQPGVRFTLTNSRFVSFSIQPSLGAGYASLYDSVQTAGQDGRAMETQQRLTTSFLFSAGSRFLFAHRSGLLVSASYDFLFNRSLTSLPPTSGSDRSEISTNLVQHQFTFNLGFDLKLGPEGLVRLRPEIAFAIAPVSSTIVSRVGSTNSSMGYTGGLAWALVPGFAVALQTPRSREDEEAETQEEDEARRAEEEARDDREEAEADANDEEKPKKKRRRDPSEEADDAPAKDEDEPKKKKKRYAPEED